MIHACVLEVRQMAKPRLKLQFEKLDYQEQAVSSVCDVFKDVPFVTAKYPEINPSFTLSSTNTRNQLQANIKAVREQNDVQEGEVKVAHQLTLDVLMETGTGKTFTFIETIYRLNQLYGLNKFLILVPSTAIRQGTVKNLNITKEFFQKNYEKNLTVFSYTPETVFRFCHASSEHISVMIATYQSFNKTSNVIHKKAVEQGLIGKSTSYIEAIAALRPVMIIDEPHRFEGKKTSENIDKFRPLFTVRLGATFKENARKQKYQNLLYTLDSITAFKKGLVKSITVDTIGSEQVDAHSLALLDVKGTKQANYEAKIHYKDIAGKNQTLVLKKGDNLGAASQIDYLSGYVVEKLTKSEIIFTNGFSLPLGAENATSYGVLLDAIQTEIIRQTIQTHFEREEALFVQGIKSLTLFFIDSVSKYLLDSGEPGELAKKFEQLYQEELSKVLAQSEIDAKYRLYLERSENNISKVHQGYFAKSNKDKDLEAEIDLILNKKEELLSFDTDLRFIFSMWALQEGWDNPNIFTLCKLAPSNSKITKLQQIGRGLRLAVNQNGQRIAAEHEAFEQINELNVIVPSTEGNFVESIQNEIAQNSLNMQGMIFEADLLIDLEIAPNIRQAQAVVDVLEDLEIIELDEDDKAHIVVDKTAFTKKWSEIVNEIEAHKRIKEPNLKALNEFFKEVFIADSKVKSKTKSKRSPKLITVNATKFNKYFKTLWDNLNRDAELKYDLNSDDFIKVVNAVIVKEFKVKEIQIKTTRQKHVENAVQEDITSDYTAVQYHSVFSLYEFVKSLANATRLSHQTIATILKNMSTEQFAMIANNENQALLDLKAIILRELYALIVNKISYDIKEIQVKETSLTRAEGIVKDWINKGACGRMEFDISGKKTLLEKSLYDESFIEIDSDIEGITIDQSTDRSITVFAKLPKIAIPVPNGTYNPDFGYVVEGKEGKSLYLVVETKGYDTEAEIPDPEKIKIAAAKKFFEALKAKETGIAINYKTKINNQELVDLLGEVQKKA